MSAGGPLWMISRSVAHTAIASMRTSTSAAPGWGTGFSTSFNSSGLPSTHAFMIAGTVRLLAGLAVGIIDLLARVCARSLDQRECARQCYGIILARTQRRSWTLSAVAVGLRDVRYRA